MAILRTVPVMIDVVTFRVPQLRRSQFFIQHVTIREKRLSILLLYLASLTGNFPGKNGNPVPIPRTKWKLLFFAGIRCRKRVVTFIILLENEAKLIKVPLLTWFYDARLLTGFTKPSKAA